jgi:hypothetical protein
VSPAPPGSSWNSVLPLLGHQSYRSEVIYLLHSLHTWAGPCLSHFTRLCTELECAELSFYIRTVEQQGWVGPQVGRPLSSSALSLRSPRIQGNTCSPRSTGPAMAEMQQSPRLVQLAHIFLTSLQELWSQVLTPTPCQPYLSKLTQPYLNYKSPPYPSSNPWYLKGAATANLLPSSSHSGLLPLLGYPECQS